VEGFIESEISLIPDEWRLFDFVKTIKRCDIGRRNQIDASQIEKKGQFPVIDQGQDYIAGYSNSEDKLFSPENPLIIFGDHTRCFKFVDFPFILGADGTKVLNPDLNLFDPKYYYFYFKSVKIQNRGYNRHFKLLKELKVICPPMHEQKTIASILSKIQSAIETQEKIIKTTTELKKTLMQKLFSEGLYDEPQKVTEIGKIPKGWKVVELGDNGVLELVQYGLSVKGYEDGKYPMLRMNTILNGYCVDRNLKYVNIEKDEFEKFKLEYGDILFNRTNSIDLVGKTGIFILKGEYTFASYLIRLKTNQRILNSFYLNHYINLESSQKRLKGLASRGVSQSNISGSRLKTFLIPLPATLREQEEIIDIISKLDKKIAFTERKRSQYNELFKSMLHQLMTGQIRVKDIKIAS